ncbi:hypothetical protein [Chromobacterium alticapitis]|uniref:Uncharacterized protein n=1 Tax=Chromobacterium alticapitis TaxID=2073169 RepID=A0A2S5DF55_9NEIS|nr:hypothetical protein [Chromobacterium alticapitis]POZ61684.1 hypothetical protein C2I19_12265 [Chromobacterium alticapitis]
MDLPLDASRLLLPATEVCVLTAGMDTRKLALLRLAFKMHAARRYRLAVDAPELTPEMALVDIDGEGWPLWQRFRRDHPALPAAIVTVSPPTDAPAPVLGKPLRIEELFPLLSELRHAPPPEPDKWTPPPRQVASPAPARTAPARIERFDPERGLLGLACLMQRQARDAAILADGAPIAAIAGSRGQAYLLCEEARLRELCRGEAMVQPGDWPETERLANASPHPLKPLLWQWAIWTARGRLLCAIQADTPLRLRHWPNLTRLAPIPDAHRVCALLARAPVNLRIVARLLHVAPANLFDFLAAAHSIGALDIGAGTMLNVISTPPIRGAPPVAAAPPPSARGGLLSRLLRKINGL